MSYIDVYTWKYIDQILNTGKNYINIEEIRKSKSDLIEDIEEIMRDLPYDDLEENFKNLRKIENETVYGKIKIYYGHSTAEDLFDSLKSEDTEIVVDIISSEEVWVKLCSEEEWIDHIESKHNK